MNPACGIAAACSNDMPVGRCQCRPFGNADFTRKRPEPGQPTVSEHLVARPEPRNAFAHRFDPPRQWVPRIWNSGLKNPDGGTPWRGLRVKSGDDCR